MTAASTVPIRPDRSLDAQPRRAPGADRPERPRLRVVEALRPARAIGRTSVIAALAVLLGVLVLQLVLSMQLIQGAYAEDALESQRLQAQRELTSAQEHVNAVASPQHLAELATGLGMVPSNGVATLDLERGAIVGGAADAPPLAPIDPALVPNSIMNGDRDAAEQPKSQPTAAGAAGASAPQPAAPAVPSEFEIATPSTR